LAEFQEFVRSYLEEDTDFGTIPGTPKPTLFKAGADKLCELYGLSDQYRILAQVEDFNRVPELFDYTLECQLWRGDRLVSTGMGSCNSYESKYKLRDQQRKCPKCGKTAIIRGKEEFGGGWLCWKKRDGCGAKFPEGAPEIESQEAGKVLNDDIATLKNTILKMAFKRAKVAATLGATRSSGIFTQDIEDMGLAVDDANGRGSKKAAAAVAEEKLTASGKEVTFAHSPDGKTVYVGGSWQLIGNVLRPAGTYSDAFKVWAIPAKDESEIVKACQEKKLDIKQVEFKSQVETAKEAPKTTEAKPKKGSGPVQANIPPLMDVEHVDPAKSKCAECDCFFGVHLKTCSKFKNPHPQNPPASTGSRIVGGPMKVYTTNPSGQPLTTKAGNAYVCVAIDSEKFLLFDNMTRMVGKTQEKMFDILACAKPGDFGQLVVDSATDRQGVLRHNVKNVLRVGDLEWLEDGTPVIQIRPPTEMREPGWEPNDPTVDDSDIPWTDN
jgi:ribosomal protein L37AE/L43A